MNVLSHLGCDKVFDYFEKICDIPHGSFHEKTLLQPRPLPLSHPITNWWENPARYVAKERL